MKNLFVIFMLVMGLMVSSALACGPGECQGIPSKGKGLVAAGSISATGAIIGDPSNGAIAGSAAVAGSVGGDRRNDMKAKVFTESLSLVYTEQGTVWNKELKGMEDYNLSQSHTESKAKANVKNLTPRRCGNGSLMFERNFVGVAGLSGATSSIGDMSQGAGSLAGGAYVAAATGNNAVMASGHSTSLTTSWMGSNSNSQWSGAYSTNTTVATVDIPNRRGHGPR
jgi:hypothetical protein